MLSRDHQLTSDSYATLFSGGRDGRINAWSLSHDSPTVAAQVSDAHTNWVFAMLPYSPQHVVSCSADTTVKLWNLNDSSVSTIGNHTDYAQCLAKFGSDSVVSGGLDEKIIGWDVQLGRSRFEISTGHSMYALASTVDGLIAGGSPDGAVRLWDPRVRLDNYITKFSDHTDSVRRVFVSGDYIVSGSSDTTIRVWSRRTGRAIRTFGNLPNSIWSLVPIGQRGFVAGDREGNIFECDDIETDDPKLVIEHSIPEGGLKGICLDLETHHCWVSTPFSPDLRCLQPQPDRTGREVEVLKGHDGLRKHRLLNDKRHALIADTKGSVSMVDLISASQVDFSRKIPAGLSNIELDNHLDEILEEVNTMDVLDNWCQVQTRAGQICVTLDSNSINNTEIYLDDLVKYVDHVVRTPVPTPNQSPVNTPGASPQGSPMTTPRGSGFFRQQRSPAVSRVTSAQSLHEVLHKEQMRQRKMLGTGQSKAQFYDPDDEDDDRKPPASASIPIPGSPPQPPPQITVSGDPPKQHGNISTDKSNLSGKLGANKPHLQPAPNSVAAETEEPADADTVDDEIRINLGNYVLENLLRGVVNHQRIEYDKMSHPPVDSHNLHPSHTGGSSSTGNQTLSPPESSQSSVRSGLDGGHVKEKKRTRFLSKLLGKGKKKEEAHPPQATQQPEPALGPNGKPLTHQQIKQNLQEKQQSDVDAKTFEDAWDRAVKEHIFKSADPEAPTPDVLSRRARVIVTEIVPGAGAPTEIFSTTVGKLITSATEVERIERVLPGWVGDAMLLGKLKIKQPTRIGFSVMPLHDGDPELAESSVRLMAISMLRARKIMSYTVGQLQQSKCLSSAASQFPPEEIISLTCEGQEIPALTTLGTIRTRIWRNGGDVTMLYSIKKRV